VEEELPAEEELPTEEEIPAEEEVLAEEELPAEEEVTAEEELSAAEETQEESEDGEDETDEEESTESDDEIINFGDGVEFSRSEALKLINQGQKFNENAENLELLDMIAAASSKADGTNYSDVSEFVVSLKSAIDDSLYQECLNDTDGDEEIAKELFEARKAKRDKHYSEILANRQAQREEKNKEKTQRVADEFLNLQKEFPEYSSYADLPKEVKQYAANNDVSLMTAKLLIDHRNFKASQKAQKTAEENKKSELGSFSGTDGSTESAEILAMRSAFLKD
ncbi:MAG: hypothetical protein IJO19_00225, partial [Clostridia bacterium]|nr:hypothetical protein [Clostridia bacterium]